MQPSAPQPVGRPFLPRCGSLRCRDALFVTCESAMTLPPRLQPIESRATRGGSEERQRRPVPFGKPSVAMPFRRGSSSHRELT